MRDAGERDEWTLPSSAGGELSVTVHRAAGEAAGAASVAVLVHGFGSSAETNWVRSGWVRRLSAAGVTAVTLDLPGHGRSAAPHDAGAYRLPGLVGDVSRVVAAVPDRVPGVRWVDLVGYSLGARLSAHVAAAIAAGAGVAVRRVVLGGYAGGPLMVDVDPAHLRELLTGDPRRAEDAWDLAADAVGTLGTAGTVGTMGMVGAAHPAVRRLAGIARALPGSDAHALLALVEGLVGEGLIRQDAPVVPQPCLLVTGADDPVAPGVRRWAQQLPAARLLVVPGRDHISVVPAALFRSTAIDFLTGAEPTGDDAGWSGPAGSVEQEPRRPGRA
ncbi:alpha/beta fold hydrolase [Nakamurella endophytica]|uniref:Alpha/beta hydrolase n=1 Tax=Nakamurella endophytica TaxID=1748367 RepID=A0A917WAS1_9ACTN|nr:alpha/beta hydrolase [Nakamurella endophytica]GGL88237.1 alpha/beta hydrolase [Nakamurella endophytica]